MANYFSYSRGKGYSSPIQQQDRQSRQNGSDVLADVRKEGLIPTVWQSWLQGWKLKNVPDMSQGFDMVGQVMGQVGKTTGEIAGGAKEFLFGPDSGGDQLRNNAATNMYREQRERQAALSQVEKVLSDVVMPGTDLLASLENAPLDAQSAYQAEQLRIGLGEQATELEQQLQQVEYNMMMQNSLYDAYEQATFGGNVIPGSTSEAQQMETMLDSGGEFTGMRPEVMQAINMILEDGSIGGEEKMARVDFMLDQVNTQQNIRAQINDYTQNLGDLQKLQNLPDVELLLQSGESPEYVTPAFNYISDPEIASDPAMRYDLNVANYLDQFLANAGVAPTVEQEEQVMTWLTGLGKSPDWENEQVKGQVQNMATMLGVDPTVFRNNIKGALNNANKTEDAWSNALSKGRIEPGSEEMAVAIFQVGSMMGLDPAMASKLAESQGLHAIIKAKSNGAAGKKTGGTQMGVGGLSEEAYTKMGIDPENLGSMDVELGALIRYIIENFQGDPDQALQYYYATGDWGV